MSALTQKDHELLAAIRQLRLPGMAESIENQLENGLAYARLDFTDRLIEAVQAQQDYARQRSYENAMKRANLPWKTTLNDFAGLGDRGVGSQELRDLAALKWVRKAVNLIIVGHSGAGKSTLASAIGENAIRSGFKAAYWATDDLVDSLTAIPDHRQYQRAMKGLARTQVLILDDFLNGAVTRPRIDALYNVLMMRSGKSPTVICTQIVPEGFKDMLIAGAESSCGMKDVPMASIDSIADRLLNPSHVIRLTGESLRKLADSSIS